jgi:DNA-binding MarR family transcriptional regulator
MPMDAGALELGLELLVRDVARLLRRRFEQCGPEFGLSLTRAQCFVLVHVGREPGLTQARLASLMDIEPIALVRLIDRLQAEKLVERRLDPKDRRVWRLYLTEMAVPTTERIRRTSATVTRRALANVPQPEHARLLVTLERLKANLSAAAPLPQPEALDRGNDGPLALVGS